jgi:hypothetical protein
VIAGYVAFLVLIRGWIALCRGRGDWWPGLRELDPVHVGEGTHGASRDVAKAARPAKLKDDRHSVLGHVVDGVTAGADFEVLSFVVMVILAALGALVAVAWVINAAPLLLAEVAIDAALVSALYRRVRQEDLAHWTSALFRLTWAPTLALVVCMSVTGFALQVIVPSAHSIGGVIHAFLS